MDETMAFRKAVLRKRWNRIDGILIWVEIAILAALYAFLASRYSSAPAFSAGHLLRVFFIGAIVAPALHRTFLRRILALIFPRHFREYSCGACGAALSFSAIKCVECGAQFEKTKYFIEES